MKNPASRFRSLLPIIAAAVLASALPGQQFTFRNYIQSDGLNNMSLIALFEDRDGLLWLGSEAGLSRYDGAKFTFFGRSSGLPGTIIFSIGQDSAGRIWSCTNEGMVVQQGNRFQTVHNGNMDLGCDGASQISGAADGSMYAATRGGVVRFRPKQAAYGWETETLARSDSQDSAALPPAVLSLRSGSILFRCGEALCESAGRSIHRLGPLDGVPKDQWTRLFEDRSGRVWARGWQHLAVSDTNDLHFHVVNAPGIVGPTTLCREIVEAKNGDILTCSSKASLARLSDGKWQMLGKANGLDEAQIGSLLASRAGEIWLAPQGKGLQKWLGYGAWNHYTTQEGLQANLSWSILVDRDGQTWVANDAGLAVTAPRQGAFHPVKLIPGVPSTGSSLAQSQSGEVWMGDQSGRLFELNGKSKRVIKSFQFSPFSKILSDRANNLWLATDNSLEVGIRKTGRWKFRKLRDGLKEGERYRSVSPGDNGDVWVATSRTILHCRLEGCQPVAGTGRVGKRFFEVVWANGVLWSAGNFPGLARLGITDDRITSVQNVRAPQLRSDRLVFLDKDLRGRIWAGGDNGVDVLTGGKWRGLNQEEGLLWNDCAGHAFFGQKDDVWIGTSGGVSHLHVPSLPSVNVPLPLPLLAARTGELPLKRTAAANVPLRFSFAPKHFRNERAIVFRYRMSGVDLDWVTSDQREVRYANVPFGPHRFMVQSVDLLTKQSSPIAVAEFETPAPWWLSQVSFLLEATFTIALGVAAWQWRIRALLKKQRSLEALVQLRTEELSRKLLHEEQLKAAAEKANFAKSEFLAMMSHEIRTPMNGVIGMASLLATSSLDSEQQDWVETIRHSGESLLAIISDILDFSKIEAGKMELEDISFDLRAVIRHAAKIIQPLAEGKRLQLAVYIDEHLPAALVGDPTRLRQVLLNLLGNAVKFTAKGRVELRVTCDALPNSSQVDLRFSVADTGMGMSPESQRRLFQRFTQVDASTTRKYGGTGLGLVISQRIVRLMHGDISVVSEEGQGSTFLFSIRMAQPAIEALPSQAASTTLKAQHPNESLSRAHILIVEDNVINQKVIVKLLRSLGYTATIAKDGQCAVDLARQQTFDAVLMDYQMPVMDGLQATREIREYEIGRRRTPIIAITANASPIERTLCLEAGMDDYLSKPVRLEELNGILERWLATPEVEAENRSFNRRE